MKNNVKLLALLVFVLLFACACATVAGSGMTDERVWAEAQRVYRISSLVVRGEAVRSHLNENGDTCYDLLVDEVLAGSAAVGDLIHVTQGSMKEGGSYLLYLTHDASDVYYSEDVSGYTLVTEEPLPVTQEDEVEFAGAKLRLLDIRASIRESNSVIAMPSRTYYYQTLAGLTDASSEIFIGRIASFSALKDTRFRSDAEGATVENTLPASVLDIEVYGALKGTLRYGERIELVYCPALNEEMIDATTLKPLSYRADNATVPEVDGVYLFFLVGSPDDKQTYYFGVNPIQGFATLDAKDRVQVTHLNRALSSYYSLDALVREIGEINH